MEKDDPFEMPLAADAHFTRVVCPHCKLTHNIQTEEAERVVNNDVLHAGYCGCETFGVLSGRTLDIVCEGPPGAGQRFVRAEVDGKALQSGVWVQRDGMHVLRLPFPDWKSQHVIEDVPAFATSLTGDARKVYDTALKSTVIETLFCKTCNTEFMPSKEDIVGWAWLGGDEFAMAHALIGAQGLPKTPEECARQLQHGNGHDLERRYKLVQFMAQTFEITLPCALVRERGVRDEIQFRAEQMAVAFNKGVQNGWLKYGCLAKCHLLALAASSPNRRFQMFVFVASDYSQEELNKLYGKHYFVQDGELGPLDVWPSPTR
jgi:hypothetical protein